MFEKFAEEHMSLVVSVMFFRFNQTWTYAQMLVNSKTSNF